MIGSLFKSWLRELPTEIFPKTTQTKIYQAHPGAEEVPQLLKDELSKLPPWNYYLLFAITCHLSLLTAYADKNRMSYSNLVICFQPCLRIDNFCFQFLVQKWRDCWQGCWTEKEALEEEYKILDRMDRESHPPAHGIAPGSSGGSSGASGSGYNSSYAPTTSTLHAFSTGEDVQSMASSQRTLVQPPSAHSIGSSGGNNRAQQANRVLALSIPAVENGTHTSKKKSNHKGHDDSSRSGRDPVRSKRNSAHIRSNSQLPPLVPMEPLSPIGL